MRPRSVPALVAVFTSPLLAVACAPPAAPQAPPPSPAPPPPAPAPAPAAPPPSLSVTLRAVRFPSPEVHVRLELDPDGERDLSRWHFAAASPDAVTNVVATDASGALGVEVRADADSAALAFARPPRGHVHVEYDVRASAEAEDPLGVVVRAGYFRGAGEALLALPESMDGASLPVSLEIDRAGLEVEKAASSFGLGASRKAQVRLRALRYAFFCAGAQGEASFDSFEGHDEASWLGFSAFDMRGAVLELAELRTALASVLGARDLLPDAPWSYLFEVSRQRPVGAMSATPRFDGLLVELGATQPWGPAVRLELGQLLAQRWIGDAIRFAPAGRPPELAWFNDGVARYLAIRVLARMDLLTPTEWASSLTQAFASLATSPYAGNDIRDVAARSANDPAAHAALAMRGALYATRESAIIAARTKGARSLESVLAGLLARARAAHAGPIQALPPSAWLEAVAREDPTAAAAFAAIVTRGEPATLPRDALGPCFRAGTGEYVVFDAGFDVDATRRAISSGDAARRTLVALRAGGPAAKAGLLPDDAVESIDVDDADASRPMKVVVERGGKKLAVTYAPRGARGRGQTWSRVKGVPDDRCGLPP